MKSLSGHDIKRVDEFKYLGSYIGSTQHDLNIIVGSVSADTNKLISIWKTNLEIKLKRNLFRYKVDRVLIYGYITWTL